MKGEQDLQFVSRATHGRAPRPTGATSWSGVGRVLLILEDREALGSWLHVMAMAQWLADGAFDPTTRPPSPPPLAA